MRRHAMPTLYDPRATGVLVEVIFPSRSLQTWQQLPRSCLLISEFRNPVPQVLIPVNTRSICLAAAFSGLFSFAVPAQIPPGEGPALKSPRVTQSMIRSGALNLRQIRARGLRIFALVGRKPARRG